MIAPKIVSHVQPSGRDYSGTTSPDLITEVPIPSPRAGDLIRREMEEIYGEERTRRMLGEAGRTTVGGALELNDPAMYERVTRSARDLERTWWVDDEAGRTTVGGALMVLTACFIIGFLFALAFLGAPTSGAAYRECVDAFQTEIGAVTAADELDCRDGRADGNR